MVFDVLFRLLTRLYPEAEVVYARNVTDVDDKINAAAIEQGVPIRKITDKFADIYDRDMASLGALPPTLQPRATAYMRQMVDLIEKLLADKAAYVSEGEVLFDVGAYEANGGQYGALSGRSLDDMVAGARVEGGGQQAQRRRLRAVEAVEGRRAVVGTGRTASSAAPAGTSSARP